MGDLIRSWMPHAACFSWSPWLLWPLAGGGVLIGVSYLTIAIKLRMLVDVIRVSQRGRLVFALFSLFILCCGIGHLLEVWVLWSGHYGSQAVWRVVTASVSVLTAIALFPLLRSLRLAAKGARKGRQSNLPETEDPTPSGPYQQPRGEDGERGALADVILGLGVEVQDLFASAGVAVSMTRPDGHVLYSSPLMVEIFGQSLQADIPVEEWAERYQPYKTDHVTPISVDEIPTVLAAKYQRRFAQPQSNMRPDNTWADIYLTASPLIKNGEVVAVVNTAIPLAQAVNDNTAALLDALERLAERTP